MLVLTISLLIRRSFSIMVPFSAAARASTRCGAPGSASKSSSSTIMPDTMKGQRLVTVSCAVDPWKEVHDSRLVYSGPGVLFSLDEPDSRWKSEGLDQRQRPLKWLQSGAKPEDSTVLTCFWKTCCPFDVADCSGLMPNPSVELFFVISYCLQIVER